VGMFKKSYSSALNPGLRGVTLEQVVREINKEVADNPTQMQLTLAKVNTVVGGADVRTPVSAFAAGAAGAVLANTVGKYFGMSPVGRTLVTAAGWGLGQQLNNNLAGLRPTYIPGWKMQ
jgi:hypothetical protein